MGPGADLGGAVPELGPEDPAASPGSCRMLILSAGSTQAKPLFGVLLLIGAARFAVTAVYQLYSWTSLETAAGWIGIPLVGFAGTWPAA